MRLAWHSSASACFHNPSWARAICHLCGSSESHFQRTRKDGPLSTNQRPRNFLPRPFIPASLSSNLWCVWSVYRINMPEYPRYTGGNDPGRQRHTQVATYKIYYIPRYKQEKVVVQALNTTEAWHWHSWHYSPSHGMFIFPKCCFTWTKCNCMDLLWMMLSLVLHYTYIKVDLTSMVSSNFQGR